MMARFIIDTGTHTTIACLLFAGVPELIAGVLTADARSTKLAIVLLGLAAALMFGHKRLFHE